MNNTNEKIGLLISQIRQEKGFTQAEFARRLKTSQSAVNRMEHGNQNFSLEILGRVSDVLNKSIINVADESVNLHVNGGHELHGTIDVKTSKNAAVGLLAASLLNKGTTTLRKVPRIEEVYRLIEVIESMGVKVKWMANNDLEIKPPAQLSVDHINANSARKTRSVLMFLGPLMHVFKEFKLPYAGGCKLGRRTVRPHLYALEELGVSIKATDGYYRVIVNKHPAKEPIVLYESGDTVTENIVMGASRFEEETVIKMASANYQVQDVCLYLKRLGVKIEGIGTTTLKIKGVKDIKKNISYSPSEDPVEAMTFIAAAVVTNSELTITRVPIEFVELEILKLKKMGLKIDILSSYIAENGFTQLVDLKVHKHNGHLHALEEKIHPNPYPGLNIDNLPYFVPIAAVAHGRTMIHDWVYDGRAIHYTELAKLGVNISLADPHRVYIDGPTRFTAADITAPPALRPAVLVLLGMLAAPGTSILRNVYTINRGYEDLANRLNAVGAEIKVWHEM
ncbi:MAG TPA: UDP-N-acetylglucosamine 1-carboxyvinyltransferase [Candidatus Saccharimonadales bacterium]|nr:UDP-N-acetylglucosamine 1-carboxyvinyltransferase [Candidatus Saccharimonadales bacterium]